MNLKYFLRHLKSTFSINLNFPFLYSHPSYSQEGEDLIIQKIFNYKKNGFYIDVGAHHPFRYSNTYLLHKNGWHGINIEADVDAIELFKKVRPNDINVAYAISYNNKFLNMYIFKDSAFNTISSKQAMKIEKSGQSERIKTLKVKTYKLGRVLTKYIPKNLKVDFLNVDVEGLDYEVLRSNNWKVFKPKVICVEILLNPHTNDINVNKITKYLLKQGYILLSHTVNSTIFSLVD